MEVYLGGGMMLLIISFMVRIHIYLYFLALISMELSLGSMKRSIDITQMSMSFTGRLKSFFASLMIIILRYGSIKKDFLYLMTFLIMLGISNQGLKIF